jgi:hypothetical protein
LLLQLVAYQVFVKYECCEEEKGGGGVGEEEKVWGGGGVGGVGVGGTRIQTHTHRGHSRAEGTSGGSAGKSER